MSSVDRKAFDWLRERVVIPDTLGALLALELGSSSAVALRKRPREASIDGGSHAALIRFVNRLPSKSDRSPPHRLGLNLACIIV